MHVNKRIFLLISIMVLTCIIVTAVSVIILYRTAFIQEKFRLTEIAQSQARLIEAIARFDSIYSNDYPDGSTSATLSQIIDAHKNYKGFGETGEFTLARKEGENIVFLLSHRHYDLNNPKPVPFHSQLAEPMRLALSGKSGTVIGLDYRGEKVLAAYEPVSVLNLGIVAKIDLSEIRKPFFHTTIISIFITIIFVIIGTLLFIRVSSPIIRKVEKAAKELKKTNESLTDEIEKHKITENTLRESEKKYRILFENANEAVFITQNEMIIFPNPMTVKLTGYSEKELTKMHFTELIPPDDRKEVIDRYNKRLAGVNFPSSYASRMLKKTGEIILVQVNFVNITWEDNPAILTFARDVTKLRQLEYQLQQSQKMESIGNLAGGVAHDYNNLSSIILGYGELALDKVDEGSSLYDDITEIIAAAKRSADITRKLLAFARKQTISPKVLELNTVINNMLKMISRLIGEDIDLAWIPSNELWPVKIDPSQIDQIVMNLCANARDAIEDVGKITIETRNAVFDDEYCHDHVGFKPGEYVMLAISDDGKGMTSEQQEKAFEPFYTTKEIGKGTGLGLSTVYGIVKQNNGFVNVYSEIEKGTTIKIYLPKDVSRAVEGYNEVVMDDYQGRGETILIVEDDISILNLIEKILKNYGYNILRTRTPLEAIHLIKDFSGKIDMLITDVVMPEMNGRELAKELQNKYTDIKVIFMSGYTANVIAHRGVLDEGINFINKPFSKKELAHKVRDILDK